MSKERIEELDRIIGLKEIQHEAFLEQKHREMEQAARAHDAEIEQLFNERTELALTEKLKGFPAVLVNEHRFCSFCNSPMRPFVVAFGEELQKIWACQIGNLSDEAHDLIHVQ